MKITRKPLEKGHIPANKQVNIVGKYLYNNIDGAFECKSSSNNFDVWLTILYEVPDMGPRYQRLDDQLHEMVINLNLTTYQNKIRVNTIEESPNERTLGFDLFKPEDMLILEDACDRIHKKVVQRISRAYEDYDFVF